jgi:hypothetical protein
MSRKGAEIRPPAGIICGVGGRQSLSVAGSLFETANFWTTQGIDRHLTTLRHRVALRARLVNEIGFPPIGSYTTRQAARPSDLRQQCR